MGHDFKRGHRLLAAAFLLSDLLCMQVGAAVGTQNLIAFLMYVLYYVLILL